MKLVCISDTHCRHKKIGDMPEGDVLVHAGDFTGRGLFFETRNFNDWLGTLDYEHKIVIAGNHEVGFEGMDICDKKKLLSNATYLEDEEHTIQHWEEKDGEVVERRIKFYGSPWTPEFCDWEFNVERGQLHKHWDKIPDDVEVLVTHGPPYGVLDPCIDLITRVGCTELKYRTAQLPKLRCHIFGHLHSGYGTKKGKGGLTYVNAAICDERYEVHRKPIIIEI